MSWRLERSDRRRTGVDGMDPSKESPFPLSILTFFHSVPVRTGPTFPPSSDRGSSCPTNVIFFHKVISLCVGKVSNLFDSGFLPLPEEVRVRHLDPLYLLNKSSGTHPFILLSKFSLVRLQRTTCSPDPSRHPCYCTSGIYGLVKREIALPLSLDTYTDPKR